MEGHTFTQDQPHPEDAAFTPFTGEISANLKERLATTLERYKTMDNELVRNAAMLTTEAAIACANEGQYREAA